jgi:hypothetical protein
VVAGSASGVAICDREHEILSDVIVEAHVVGTRSIAMSTLPTRPVLASGGFVIGAVCGPRAGGGSLWEKVAGPR